MTPPTQQPGPQKRAQHLFAFYVQMTKLDATGKEMRYQYIVMPPTPATYNGVTLIASGTDRPAMMFHRKQDNPDHRASWKTSTAGATDPAYANFVKDRIGSLTASGWTISPLIVVETLPEELLDAAAGKTPWPIINRVKRVAKKQHKLIV